MNLMGDLASWACWTVHLRTPQLDIGVIATRRKYIPPVGDQYQDIFIVQVRGRGLRVRDRVGVGRRRACWRSSAPLTLTLTPNP
jgi:hypothetical protein